MSPQALDSPVVTGAALRSANFFNGRLLTGEDLRREQATIQARLQRLGRAAGEGVAYGLEVTETIGTSTNARPVVSVSAGLALTRSGQALELAASVDVVLAREHATDDSEPGGLFADCQPFAPGTYTAGAGVYVLAIGPAQQGEGRAPVSGLTNEPAPCNVAVSVEAVRFRLIRLALPPSELAEKPLLRNRVAYRCFAPEALGDFVRDPFGSPSPTIPLVDVLRTQTLSDDEVPLAVIGWSVDDGIKFVDLWAVRRRIVMRPDQDPLSVLLGDRRRAETEAMTLQFQAHLDDLLLEEPATTRARERFERLPPVGLLPLAVSAFPGFDLSVFFAGLTITPPAFIAGAKLDEIVLVSLAHPPIDLASAEAIRTYVVRENQLASASATGPYVVFCNGHVPYRGDAEYDLAYWNFANYARACR